MRSLQGSLRITLRWWIPFSFGAAYGAWSGAAPADVILGFGAAGLVGAIFLYHRAIRDFALFLWDMRPIGL